VLYNGFAEAEPCIRSVLGQTVGVPLQLYLIDNASPDSSGEQLLRVFGETAQVICNQDNIGFGKGHNSCLARLTSKYHVVINPDITLTQDAITGLCSYLDTHPDVVMVTPRLCFPDGKTQYIAKRPPNVLALAARQLNVPCLKPYENHYLMLDRDLTREQEISFCTGCFFVIRTDVLKHFGGFDPDYFLYVEDADITRRAMKYGKVMYVPQQQVIHAWHRAAHKSLRPFLLQLRSMLLYFRKWGFCFGLGKKATCLPVNTEIPPSEPKKTAE